MKSKCVRCGLTIAACVLSVFPAVASGDSGDGLGYASDSSVLTELVNGKDASGDVAISPFLLESNTCRPKRVFKIGRRAFAENATLTSVVVPDSVCLMEEYAFGACSSLTNVVLGSGLSRLPLGAFDGCRRLEKVTFGTNVTSIGEAAFYGCTNLTEIELPEGLTHIGSSAFKGCTSLVRVKVPSTLKVIEKDAFRGCASLTTVTGDCDLESCAEAFGETPFASRDSDEDFRLVQVGSCVVGYKGILATVVSPPDTSRKEEYVDKLVIPYGVTTIADCAFSQSENVTDGPEAPLGYNRNVPSPLGDGQLDLPIGLRSIGSKAFLHCAWIKKVTGGRDVEAVGDAAFYGTMYSGQGYSDFYLLDYEGEETYKTFRQVILGSVLVAVKGPWPSAVVIADGVRRISPNVFYCGSGVIGGVYKPEAGREYWRGFYQELGLPDRPYTKQFRYDAQLKMLVEDSEIDTSKWMTSLTLPSSLERLDEDAFKGAANNLSVLTGGENLHDVADYPFGGSPLEISLRQKGGFLRLGDTVFGWTGDSCPETLEIPEGVAAIADLAFYRSEYYDEPVCTLRRVVLPSTLRRIGWGAFRGQKLLENPVIPEGVEYVGGKAFAYCSSMTELTLPSTLKGLGNAIVFNGMANSTVTTVTFLGNAPELFDDDSRFENSYCPLAFNMNSHPVCKVVVQEGSTGWIAEGDPAVPSVWPWRFQSRGWKVETRSPYVFVSREYPDEYGWYSTYACVTAVNPVRPVMSIPPFDDGWCTVADIGPQAFGADAATLVELTIPSTVRFVDPKAFEGCTSLTTVRARTGLEAELRAAIVESGLDVSKVNIDLCPWIYEVDGLGTGVFLTGVDADSASQLLAGDVTLPSAVRGLPVTGIEHFDGHYDGLTSVTLPDSVKFVYDSFMQCPDLKRVAFGAGVVHIAPRIFAGYNQWGTQVASFAVSADNACYQAVDGVLFSKNGKTLLRFPAGRGGEYAIPEGVTSVAESAFSECGHVSSLRMPASVAAIAADAFEFCSSLTNIAVSENNETYASVDGMLLNKDRTRVILVPAGKTGTVVVPEGVTDIGPDAFLNVKASSVVLPASLKTIYNDAFLNCSVEQLTVRSSAMYVSPSAFYGCESLYAVFSGGSVRDSLRNAMASSRLSVDKIQFLDFGQTPQILWTTEDDGAGGVVVTDVSPALATVVVPDEIDGRRVTAIGEGFLQNNIRITSISLPGGLSRIEDYAFRGCEGVASITWRGAGPAVIGNFAFAFMYDFSGILVLPEGIREIGNGAFRVNELTSVTLPNSLTNIQGYAFCDSMSLTDLTFGTGIEAIGENAFLYCDTLKTVRVPPEKLTLVQGALTASGLDVTKITFVTDGACQLPELPPDATSDDVAEALAGAADSRLAENIADVAAYNAFRTWAQSVPGGDAAVLASTTAWTSFALDAASLLARQPTDDDLTVVSFAPSATAGRFDFVVSVKGVTVGGGATSANLLRILGIEGATTLSPKDFRPENATVDLAAPSGGNVRLTVGPAAADAPAFFMRARVCE